MCDPDVFGNVSKGTVTYKAALVQLMAWRRTGQMYLPVVLKFLSPHTFPDYGHYVTASWLRWRKQFTDTVSVKEQFLPYLTYRYRRYEKYRAI